MHEVKVYDSSGKLKKVITVKALNLRSIKQMENPSIFKRNKKGRRFAKKPEKGNKSSVINNN